MKLSFPHMGTVWVPMKALCQELGIDLVIPPQNTTRTLSLGVKHAPEGLCIPFKITLGNFIEALELGADTLIQAGGAGICRLGRYAKTQEWVMRDLGYQFDMLVVGVSDKKLRGLMGMFKAVSNNASWLRIFSSLRFAISKQGVIDRIERQTQRVRPREVEKGTATRLYRESIAAVDAASDSASLRRVEKDYAERLDAVPTIPGFEPLIVGVTGEFYVVLEPFSNLDVEIELGKLGVEVRRMTFVSEWTKFSWFLNPLGVDEKKRIHRAARPYLKRDIGGDGWESVGEKVLHAKEYDGLIQLAPFTCMPEIIAQNIMPSTKESIPVLTITCDEQMGKPGMLTRLEAFVDLLERRRQKRHNNHQ
ncbi:MAG: CoA protein activase [Dehalococcoidia bacterium]|nr:CoA protein activase [Dehalococcoidia bacterium]